jgi:hypothetical protein
MKIYFSMLSLLFAFEAYASKARMMGLAQDQVQGSQYLQGTRNIFRNAAEVNNYGSYVVSEWGNSTSSEGGAFNRYQGFSYGAYLGAAHRDPNLKQFVNDSTVDYTANFNPLVTSYKPGNELDFFLGREGHVSWGLRAGVRDAKNDVQKYRARAYTLGMGILHRSLSLYTQLDLSDKREDRPTPTTTTEYKGKLGLQFGGSYTWDQWVFHADYRRQGADVTTQGTVGTNNAEYTELTVGAAHILQSGVSKSFIATDFIARNWENKNSQVSPARAWERKDTLFKMTLGFEHPATQWLMWRGAISQNIILGKMKHEGSQGYVPEALRGKSIGMDNSTQVSAGASLVFGKLQVDGTLANITNASLNLNNVLANVGVTYQF